jgi:hypothetical protein
VIAITKGKQKKKDDRTTGVTHTVLVTTIRFLRPTSNHPSSLTSASSVSSTAGVFLIARVDLPALLDVVWAFATGDDDAVAEIALTMVKSSSSKVSR